MELSEAKRQIEAAIEKLVLLLGKLSTSKQRKGAKKVIPFDNDEFTRLYTICYNACVDQNHDGNADELYALYGNTFERYLAESVLVDLGNVANEDFIQEFVEKWRQHQIMTRWLKMMFRYLDRFYVKQFSKLTLEDLAIAKFREIVYGNLKEKLVQNVLGLINVYRDNHTEDISVVAEFVQILVGISTKETANTNDGLVTNFLDVYMSDFEKTFLISTYDYYSEKSKIWINDHMSKYLRIVSDVLEFEKNMVLRYFQGASRTLWLRRTNNVATDDRDFENESSTLAKVLAKLRTVCLKEKEVALLVRDGNSDGFNGLLTEMKVQDLRLTYSLFKHVESGLVLMGRQLREFIISDCSKIGALSKKTDDIIKVVDFLNELHDKFVNLIDDQFSKNALLARAMKEAFESIINSLEGTDKKKITFAEVLSSYMDVQLRNKKIDDTTRGKNLDRAIKLFLYLEEKDRFSEIYRNQLSKRLLSGATYDTVEVPMILKFKSHLGGGYTNKMEGMVKDLMTGQQSKAHFQKYAVDSYNYIHKSLTSNDCIEIAPNKEDCLTFSVDLLTQGYWPATVQLDLHYPPEMKQCLDLYYDFVKSEMDQKKAINWVHSLGSCIIVTNIGGNELELSLTTLQAAALLLFNEVDFLHFKEISERLNIDSSICKKVLHSFFRVGVLLKKGGKSSKKIDVENDVFFINEGFKPKRNKFKVPMPSLEETHNPKVVSEDRKDAIDAAIVRIMKSRKKYDHNALIGDVMQQLHFFRPTGKQIKQRIENLIDREYLERDEENTSIYLYVS